MHIEHRRNDERGPTLIPYSCIAARGARSARFTTLVYHLAIASLPDDWRNGKHVVYRLHTQIVVTPKWQRMVMTDQVAADLRSFEEVCGRFDGSHDDSRPTAPCPPSGHLPTKGRTLPMSIRRGGDVTEDELVEECEGARLGRGDQGTTWGPLLVAVGCCRVVG